MMVFYWPLLHKRDSLALSLWLELLGTSQFVRQSPLFQQGAMFLETHSTYILLQGLETLEFPPPSPSDLAPKRQQSPL